MANIIAALDQGTTSTRCLLFDSAGRILTKKQIEHRQHYPQPGWVEHDPQEILENARKVLSAALADQELKTADLAALGITNQRETTVVWEKSTGNPIHHALVWQDTRTDQICRQLAANGGQDRFREITGLPLSTYFAGPKIKWLLDHVEGARKQAQRGELLFGTIDTWLIWNLTGGPDGGKHLTDVTNASRTLLMDLKTLSWSEPMCEELGIPLRMLPTIRPSSALYGQAAPPWEGLTIAGNLGDQQAALFGQACFQPGDAKNTYGTGCFLLLNTGINPTFSEHGLITTVGYQIEKNQPVYALEGSVAIAGALVQWLRDNLGFIENAAEVEDLATSVEDNGGIYFVPAFSGLYAPYWRSDARGIIAGLTRFITKEHIARAALEATAYQTLEILDAMENDSGVKLQSLMVDGGMVANDFLMQFQADLLNVPVVRPQVTETTSLGAAYAAGLAVGFWDDLEALQANWTEEKVWQPDMSGDVREKHIAGWKKAVNHSLNWVK